MLLKHSETFLRHPRSNFWTGEALECNTQQCTSQQLKQMRVRTPVVPSLPFTTTVPLWLCVPALHLVFAEAFVWSHGELVQGGWLREQPSIFGTVNSVPGQRSQGSTWFCSSLARVCMFVNKFILKLSFLDCGRG